MSSTRALLTKLTHASSRSICTSSFRSSAASSSFPAQPRRPLQLYLNHTPTTPSVPPTHPSSAIVPPSSRHYSAAGSSPTPTALPSPPDYLNAAEQHIFNLLCTSLQPTQLSVQDISGGCGSMYGIEVVSDKFKGLSVMKQHRLVNGVLGDEIKKWHGVQLKTKVPE